MKKIHSDNKKQLLNIKNIIIKIGWEEDDGLENGVKKISQDIESYGKESKIT